MTENNYEINLNDLIEIFEEFREEMGRKPSISEFFSLLFWSVKKYSGEDINLNDTARLDGLKIKAGSIEVKIRNQEILKNLGELNDNCFVVASIAVSNLGTNVKKKSGSPVSLRVFFDLIVKALKTSKEQLFNDPDVSIEQIDVILAPRKKSVIRKGDLIEISLPDGTMALAIMIAKTSFGIALGVFKKRYQEFNPAQIVHDEILPYTIFTESSAVEAGRWKILPNVKNLLSRFPGEPEKFHSPLLFDQAKPFGLGETSDGTLRQLSNEEAKRIGLLENDFQQVFIANEVEKYLDKKLR